MIKTIWKYELNPRDLTIKMPINSTILTAREQGDKICLWVEVYPEQKQSESRTFEIYGTGHDIYCDMGIERKYIGTAILYGGSLVFHVYERLWV